MRDSLLARFVIVSVIATLVGAFGDACDGCAAPASGGEGEGEGGAEGEGAGEGEGGGEGEGASEGEGAAEGEGAGEGEGEGEGVFKFVTSAVHVPSTPGDADDIGFNLDNDGGGKVDNALGSLLATFADPSSGSLDLQGAADAAIASGASVELQTLRAVDIENDDAATWETRVGVPATSAPLFDGTDAFVVDGAGPDDAPLPATIVGRHLFAGPGPLTLLLPLFAGQPPLELELVGGFVDMDVSAAGCTNGRIGGGVTQTDLDNVFIPAFAAAMDARVGDDGDACRTGQANGDPSACSQQAQTILQIFDKAPRDGTISLDEVANNTFLQTMLTLDVDLLDDAGNANPTPPDDPAFVADSLSLAVGFECVAASF